MNNPKQTAMKTVLESITFSKSHREIVGATLQRMDNQEWAKLFLRFRREGKVNLWEVVKGDEDLAIEMLDLNRYYSFLE